MHEETLTEQCWFKRKNTWLTQIALISDSWPVKVCLHMPSRISQSLAEASQAPETNNRESGARDRLMTSPVCPANVVVCWPVSMSQSALENQTGYQDTWSDVYYTAQSRERWHLPSGVSRACNNLVVIEKATAGQVSWNLHRQVSIMAFHQNSKKHNCSRSDRNNGFEVFSHSKYLHEKMEQLLSRNLIWQTGML